MAKKKVSRKQLLNEPDPILESTGKVVSFLKENQTPILLGIALLLVVIVGVSSFRYLAKGKEDKAFFTFNTLVTTYDETLSKEDKIKAFEAVKEDFVQLIDSYGGYSGGKLAQLYFAHLCFDSGQTDMAIEHYLSSLKTFKNDPVLKGIVLNGLGYAYLLKEEGDKAADYFKELSDSTAVALKDVALFNLAKSYELKGDMEKSTAYYKQIVADYPESIFINVIKEKIVG